MKTLVCTLNIGNHNAEICAVTMPSIIRFADKIGADFRVIDTPFFCLEPEKSGHGGEKFQIPLVGQGYDWVWYLDSDTLVHPDAVDWTVFLTKDLVLFNAMDPAPVRFTPDKYNRRSKSFRGACTWCVACSDWTIDDLWRAPSLTECQKALDNIHPIVTERNGCITREHLIDDYWVSRNLARYNLYTETIVAMQPKLGVPQPFAYHLYNTDAATKLKHLTEVRDAWASARFGLDANHNIVLEAAK